MHKSNRILVDIPSAALSILTRLIHIENIYIYIYYFFKLTKKLFFRENTGSSETEHYKLLKYDSVCPPAISSFFFFQSENNIPRPQIIGIYSIPPELDGPVVYIVTTNYVRKTPLVGGRKKMYKASHKKSRLHMRVRNLCAVLIFLYREKKSEFSFLCERSFLFFLFIGV